MTVSRIDITKRATTFLRGQTVDVVVLTEWILQITVLLNHLSCTLSIEEGLTFSSNNELSVDVPIDSAKGKLRMICARLVQICEQSGCPISPYGGETTFIHEIESQGQISFHLRFTNTTETSEFHLTRIQ